MIDAKARKRWERMEKIFHRHLAVECRHGILDSYTMSGFVDPLNFNAIDL